VNRLAPTNIAVSRSVPAPPPPPTAISTPPPPPPAPPAAPSLPQFKAIYPFKSQEQGEIAFEKGDILEIIEKDENGKCFLCF
jgi:myosin-1